MPTFSRKRAFSFSLHLAAAFCLVPFQSPGAESRRIDVFVGGQEGYHTYRIPAVITSANGTVLAFCEGRKDGRGDSGNIDVVLKRSFDGGRTWQRMQTVWDDAENTCGNPCPVVDRATGTIWLPLTHNLGADTESQILDRASQGTRTVWITRSLDDGATWSKPVEITRDVKKPAWTWYATGPGVGVQTRTGRLVIPCDHVDGESKLKYSHIVFSDDHGQTWKLGGAAGPHCNECQVAELTDGSLHLNMRSYHGKNRRALAVSRDGGLSWSDPALDPTLVEPVCQASLLRYPKRSGDGQSWLLFSNPASVKRERMTVRLSKDGGQTWPLAKVLHDGPAAYSSLAILPDGAVACLYECGLKSAYERISLATLELNQFGENGLKAPNEKPKSAR